MTVQEVIAAIPQFTHEERLELIKSLSRSLTEVKSTRPQRANSANKLRGILRPADGKIPDDEEVKEIITDYLMEKYS